MLEAIPLSIVLRDSAALRSIAISGITFSSRDDPSKPYAGAFRLVVAMSSFRITCPILDPISSRWPIPSLLFLFVNDVHVGAPRREIYPHAPSLPSGHDIPDG